MVKQDYLQEKGVKTKKQDEAQEEQGNVFQRGFNAVRNFFRRNR